MRKKGRKRMAAVIFSSIGVLLIMVFGTLMMVSGIFEQPGYLKPWNKSYSKQFTDPRMRLVAHGLLAANGHNMQPWTIRLDPDQSMVFYLYADSERFTDKVDPYARQMMVSQGTFLEYVSIAGDALGYKVGITLFPEGNYNEKKLAESMQTKPVAAISLAKSKPHNNALYNYMFLPDTNRGPYRQASLTTNHVEQLQSINDDSDISIQIFQKSKEAAELGDYAIKGATVEAGVTRVMNESEEVFRANEFQKNKYRYGFSVEGQGSCGVMKHFLQGLVTIFPSMNSGKAAADQMIRSTRTSVDNTPAYAMIITDDNSRASQVRSGMLYSRMILTAKHAGLALQPLSQVLEEYPEMKELYSTIHRSYAPGGRTIQMLVRVGQPEKEVPLSMRREATELLDTQ